MDQNEAHENLDELEAQVNEEVEQLKQSLEKTNLMGSKLVMVKYQNFWCRIFWLKDIIFCQKHFKAQDSDIILATQPKSGTTWLKSLIYAIVNRFNPDHQPLHEKNPLLTHNPHELVYFLEHGVYREGVTIPNPQQVQELPSPRLLSTHIRYASLPESIKTSGCKIVYLSRNPFDTCVSHWHWHAKLIKMMVVDPEDFKPPSIEDFFEDFCQGKFPSGPYFEHNVEFWYQSLEHPNKVLFLKYEDLKSDNEAISELKKLAEFVGFPFSAQEEREGVIKDIIKLCSIDNLKGLEVNKTGLLHNKLDNKHFFRKGEVGDWTNYFTPSMVERLNSLIEEKFGGTGLSFDSIQMQ